MVFAAKGGNKTRVEEETSKTTFFLSYSYILGPKWHYHQMALIAAIWWRQSVENVTLSFLALIFQNRKLINEGVGDRIVETHDVHDRSTYLCSTEKENWNCY